MKLKKIVKHLDSFGQIRLYDEDEKVVFDGGIEILRAAADEEEMRMFIADCREEKDYESIALVATAAEYMNYHLDSGYDYEAISWGSRVNEYGVTIPIMSICLKKEKD